MGAACAGLVLLLSWAPGAEAQAPFRKIGELELSLLGISASIQPESPVIPRNIPAGVRIVVRAGGVELPAPAVEQLLNGPFQVHAELSGPGLPQTLTLPVPETPVTDPLLLPFPGLGVAGDYRLTNTRIVVAGQTALGVSPEVANVRVIDQVLVTSVMTRALTLDEIRERGIVLDSDSYLGFEFTLGLSLESNPVTLSFPVVFDRRGVPVPQPLLPLAAPPRQGLTLKMPTLVPMMLERVSGPGDDDPSDDPPLSMPDGTPVRIPGLLVIPGDVGYLKQHFAAQLFVANGAPGGSGLVLHDVTGTIVLPPGPDGQLGTDDDPLTLPDTANGPQPETLPVVGLGPDGEPGTGDDDEMLSPGEQGQAEFTLRGESEGFHPIAFDIEATLEGLATGPVTIHGKARGGVLVRNPYFDMTFTVPSVVRADEEFDMFVTVTNVGQGTGNLVTVTIDDLALSGAELLSDPSELIETLPPGDSRTIQYRFRSLLTGEVVASYLRFDTQGGPAPSGELKFTMGVGERGVALSPDTLVLPSSVQDLPPDVVRAAMRVLGQAWSVAQAPTLPAGVLPISGAVVKQKALAFAEAGLRKRLGQPEPAALRDLVFDFHGGDPRDDGFDQLLRQTQAGRNLDAALGRALAPSVGQPTVYEREAAEVASSGPDFVSFAVGQAGALDADVVLRDAAGNVTRSGAAPLSGVPGAVLVPLSGLANPALLGLATAPLSTGYTLEVLARTSGESFDLSVTLPRADGSFAHGTASLVALSAGGKARLALTPGASADGLVLEIDGDGDGAYEQTRPLQVATLESGGPTLVAAAVIGPETLSGASPFGYFGAMLFDRVVDAEAAGQLSNYEIPKNRVEFAKRQLSGRIVFMALEQPEGEYVPTTVRAERIEDLRGKVGPSATVDLTSQLLDPGAIVTGRVFRADGTPLPGVVVTYSNNKNFSCLGNVGMGVAAIPSDASGFFEFRYVRQDQCGFPFRLEARDPQSSAVRSVTGYVRTPGELIQLDIAFLGYGSVAGTVRKLDGNPAPGASVRVISVTDPQVGGLATTDVLGQYLVPGITVGQVVVDAAFETLLGHASGNVPTAGATAQVDVVLDGVSNVSGTVYRLEGTTSTPVPGLLVLYYTGLTLTGVDESDAQGRFEFLGVPAGPFMIRAQLPTGEQAQVSGSVAPGQTLPGQNVVITVQGDDEFGTLRGTVLNADLTPAGGAIVNVGAEGALTAGDGSFEITRVPVRPFQYQSVYARSANGLSSGSAQFQVNVPGQVVTGVEIRLSGLGSVEFLVLDSGGQPVANQQVRLGGFCGNPCGCNPKTTGADGKVRYDGLPLGGVSARAVRVLPEYTDVASGTASITQTATPAQGVLRFNGIGTVQGTVLLPGTGTDPAHGADVVLTSQRYFNDGFEVCGLVPTASATRTDQQGHFEFPRVNVGPVRVSASSFVFPTPVGAQGTLTGNGQTVSFTLRLVDTIAGALSGRVFLPDGTTPAGANVEVAVLGPVPEVKVRTDADGNYHFAPILPQGSYVATVRDPATGGLIEEHLYLPAGQPTLHDFRLKDKGPVQVRVVEANNTPVESAFVRLKELEYPRRVFEGVADASNGSVVTFPGIYQGPITAEAFDVHGQGGRTSGTRPPGTAPVEIKVTLGATGAVQGHFLMPGGAPIPYGAVRLIAGGQVIAQTTTAGSGDVGSYFFDYVPAGPVRLEAEDPLTARTGLAVGSVGLDETLTLDVHAQALGRVEGVVTSNGVAAGGASVTLRSGSYQASTSTDGLGAYRIEGVPAGLVVATASYAGGFLQGSASAALTTEGQTLVLNVALHDSGTIQGQVLPASGPDPAPLSLVTVQVGGWSQNVISDPDGGFQFAQVPTGLATLTADVLGSIDLGRATAEVPAGGTVQADVPLNGVGILTGEITDSGSPIAGRLTLTGTGPFQWSRVLYIPSDGQFALPEVLAGPFNAQLLAQIGGFTLYGSGTGVVAPGQTTHIVVAVQDSGRVIGRVLRPDALPAYGANVTVQVMPGGASVTVPTDTQGSFEARGVPLGTVTVRVADPATGGVALATGLSLPVDGATADAGTLTLDDTPVAVASVDPQDGAIGIATNRPVLVTFTDPLGSASGVSIKKGTVTLGSVATLSSDRLTVALTPYSSWPDSSALDVVASTSVTDVFGRHPAQVFTSRFTTVDLSPPAVTAVSPQNQAIQVPPSAQVAVTFSEPLSDTSPFDTLVQVVGPSGAVTGSTVLTSPTTVTFAPAQALQINGTYTVTVNGAVDLSGNQQTQAFASSFKTLDTIAPVLSLSSPGSGAWVKVPRPSIIVLTNDGAGSGIDTASDSMLLDGAAVGVSANAAFMTHSPAADLAQGQHAVAASAADRAGNVGTLSGAGFGVDTIPPDPGQVLGVSEGQVLSGTVTLGGLADDPGSGAGTGSGVSRIDLLRDSVVFLTLFPPFSQGYNTAGLSEGPHALTARATDVAGNVGPAGPVVNVIVDNVPVVVTITAPPAGAAFRDLVPVSATASQVVERLEFRVGSGPAVADTTAPYQAVLDVTAVPEGPATITATAFGFGGETASATRGIVVDRTAPAAPDTARIRAEDSGDDTALVLGQSGAVESAARVEITNLDRGAVVTVTAAADGSFAGHVAGALGNTLSLLAVDAAGNRSPAVQVVVEEGNASGDVPLTGLRMWLKAELGVERDASNVVSAWRDQNPNGTANDLVQAVAAARPLYVENAVGGNRPTIRFDGSNDYLQFTTRLTNVRTVFWVIRETPGTPAGARFLLGDSIDYHFYPGSSTIWNVSNTSPLVRDGQLSVDSQAVDGLTTARPQVMSVVSLATNGDVNADSFSRDRGGAGYWRGDLSELLIYDRPLSGAERKRVEDYLALKYALYLPQVAAPSISPDGGRFSGSTTVTLSTTTPGAAIHYTLDGSEPDALSPVYADPLVFSQSVTLKARAFLEPYPASETSVASFVRDGDLSPLAFTGLRMWLRADAGVVADSSGRVSVWRDQSGNAADALQTASSRQPVRNPDVVGGLPALAFDGQDDFIGFPRMTNVRTVFWVLRQDPAANAVPHFLLGDSTDYHFYAGNTAIWNPSYASPSIRDGQTRLNGTPVDGLVTPRPTQMTIVSLVTTGNVSADTFSRDRGSNSGFWWGDLAELVMYDRALAPSEVRSVEDYLALKYRPYPVPAGTPSFSPDGGTFTGAVEVTLSSTTPGAEIRYTTDQSEPTGTSALYEGPLTLTDTTTLKAKAFRSDLQPSVTAVATFERSDLFTPRSVPGLQLWVRPDAGMPTEGSHAALWLDQSGFGNDLFQLQGDRQPEIVPDAVNGWPALRFDGNDYLRFTNRLTTIRSVFWVIRQDPGANAVPHFLLGDSTDYHFFAGNTTIWNPSFASPNIRAGQTWINGTPVDGLVTPRPTSMSVVSLITTGSVNADSFSKDRGGDSGYWWGDLAELVIYDRPLTGPERHDVEEYLRLKYRVVPGERAAVPSMTPNGGSFTGATTASLSTTTPGAEIRFTTDGSEPDDTSELYQEPFPVTATTTVKAKAFRSDLQPSQTAVVTLLDADDFAPSDVANLALWVRADAGIERDGDRVSTWRDQSASHDDLVHADAGMSLPSWRASVAGGLPGVYFDGDGEYLKFTSRLTTIRTVFWVIRQDPGASAVPHFLLGDSTDYHFFAGNTTIWNGSFASPSVRAGTTRLNGTVVNGTTTPRPTAMSVISLVTTGNVNADNLSKDRTTDSGYWWGDLAELVIFDRDLNPAEVTQVQQYLGSRYGIVVQP